MIRRTRLSPISKKRSKELRIYAKLRKEFLGSRPKFECCGKRKATDIHHTKGRGPFYLATETWKALCRACHDHIHQHPAESRRLGLLS